MILLDENTLATTLMYCTGVEFTVFQLIVAVLVYHKKYVSRFYQVFWLTEEAITHYHSGHFCLLLSKNYEMVFPGKFHAIAWIYFRNIFIAISLRVCRELKYPQKSQN